MTRTSAYEASLVVSSLALGHGGEDGTVILHGLVQCIGEGKAFVGAGRQSGRLRQRRAAAGHRFETCGVRRGLLDLPLGPVIPIHHRPCLRGVVPAANMAPLTLSGQPAR